MQQLQIITGAKLSKGEVEGRSYDSTKVYIQTNLDTSKGEMVGTATTEFSWGTSENFDKLKDLTFPCQAKVSYEIITTGRSNRMIVTDVEPVKTSVKS